MNSKTDDVRYFDVSFLNKKRKEELDKMPASQLDLIYIHENIKGLREDLQTMSDTAFKNSDNIEELVELIKKSQYTEVCNGDNKKHPRLISELIGELWERDTSRRNRARLLESIKPFRKVLILSIFSLLIILYLFHNQFAQLGEFLLEHLPDAIKFIF